MFTKKCFLPYLSLVILLTSCSKSTLDFMVKQPTNIAAPAKFVFNALPSGYDNYIWNFGDGKTEQDSVTTHTYYTSGTYDVELKAIKGDKVKVVKKQLFVKAPEKCLVLVETNMGNMLVELYHDTPKHRDNFLKLAEQGYFNGTLFHRVIKGFMIQGGDPNSRNAGPDVALGMGGPDYVIDAEILPNHAHIKKALAAARTADQVNPEKKSSGSQFFVVQGGGPLNEVDIRQYEMRLGINYTPEVKAAYLKNGGVPFLDQNYTVFGQVLEGLEVIDAIANVKTAPGDRPLENVVMNVKVVK